ncbi:MAG: ABC transporter substrate-binding protein [Chloroflexi bacterium]|nr:ABC transporter substrate-binding protein [Chloroflexota bacterium]
MRALAIVVIATLACTSPAPTVATPTPTAEGGVLNVVALLDLSGPRAAIGRQQRDALQLWMSQQRSSAPLLKVFRLRTVDVAGSDAKLLIELRRAAVEEMADAVIVGPPVTYDDTLGRAVELAGVPVLFTQPLGLDPAGRGGGRWAFALAPTLSRIAELAIDDAYQRDVLRPSLVLTDGRERVDPVASALTAEMERRRLDPLTRVAMPADGSVVPVVRSSLSVLRSVHCTALPSSCVSLATLARSMSAPTFFYLSYSTAPADLADHADLAQRAVFPGSRALLSVATRPLRPIDQARDRFVQAFGERYGPAGTHAAVAHDALALIAAATERSGPDDRAALRDALERISMPLIAGTYAFTSDRHAGSDPADLAYLRWAGSTLAPALLPSLGTGLPTPAPTATPVRSPSPSASPSRSPSATP